MGAEAFTGSLSFCSQVPSSLSSARLCLIPSHCLLSWIDRVQSCSGQPWDRDEGGSAQGWAPAAVTVGEVAGGEGGRGGGGGPGLLGTAQK